MRSDCCCGCRMRGVVGARPWRKRSTRSTRLTCRRMTCCPACLRSSPIIPDHSRSSPAHPRSSPAHPHSSPAHPHSSPAHSLLIPTHPRSSPPHLLHAAAPQSARAALVARLLVACDDEHDEHASQQGVARVLRRASEPTTRAFCVQQGADEIEEPLLAGQALEPPAVQERARRARRARQLQVSLLPDTATPRMSSAQALPGAFPGPALPVLICRKPNLAGSKE